MNKELTVVLLHKDIAELAQLTDGFGQMETIPPVLLHLAQSKANSIVTGLNDLARTANEPLPEPQPEPAIIPAIETKEDNLLVEEPASEVPTDTPTAEAESHLTAEEANVEEESEEEPIVENERDCEIDASTEEAAQEQPDFPTDLAAEQPDEQPDLPTEHHVPLGDGTNAAPLLNPHISDIKQGISLGDHFLFQRELFAGNGELMTKTIAALNACQSLEEAQQYMAQKFRWESDSPAVEHFLQIVNRRFV